jgi:hypothetical protein
MMTDRELLEMAAKAAGKDLYAMEYEGGTTGFVRHKVHGVPRLGFNYEDTFSPLTDDGDALRLAVALGLSVMAYPVYSMPKHAVIVKQYRSGDAMRTNNPTEVVEPYGDDANAATRRAIVKSAAEIGRSMK